MSECVCVCVCVRACVRVCVRDRQTYREKGREFLTCELFLAWRVVSSLFYFVLFLSAGVGGQGERGKECVL